MTKVWVVIQEIESGIYADGSTYQILGVYGSQASADDARDEWRLAHEGNRCDTHAFNGDEDDDWCETCECALTISDPFDVDPLPDSGRPARGLRR